VWIIAVGVGVLAGVLVTVIGFATGLFGMSSGSSSGNIPYITPPFERVVPSGLADESTNAFHGLQLDSSAIRDRFFNEEQGGPTKFFQILSDVDTRLQSINSRMDGQECLSQEPVAYPMTIYGQEVTFYFQCYDAWQDNSGFVQFGQKDGLWYMYQRGGATLVGAIATVANNEITDAHVWYSCGVMNSPFYNMSYGVVEVVGNVTSNSFEMVVAGLGYGYCGAQLKTDNTLLWVEGSVDYDTTCAATDTACVEASDVTVYTTGCDTSSVSDFSLTALGREESYGWQTIAASQYPGGSENTVVLDGTSTDTLHFGPTGMVSGVTEFR